MAKGRKTQPTKNPATGRWRLYAQPATETTYLGGLTLPALTKRPHMGPFNRVTDYKISDADEVYRKHDLGYGKEIKAGRSPYTRWNKYDQALMDAPSTGWPDYLAKGIFGAKRFFTYGLPYAKNTNLKPTYGKPNTRWEPTTIDDFTVNEQSAPFVYEGTGTDPDVLELQAQQQARRWATKGGVENFTRQNTDTGGSGKRNIRSSIRYERY